MDVPLRINYGVNVKRRVFPLKYILWIQVYVSISLLDPIVSSNRRHSCQHPSICRNVLAIPQSEMPRTFRRYRPDINNFFRFHDHRISLI